MGASTHLPVTPVAINPSRGTSYCIVWRPMPVITWIFPFFGHIGVCNSTGEVFDFSPWRNTRFGPPVLIWKLDPAKACIFSGVTENTTASSVPFKKLPACGGAIPTCTVDDAWDLAIQESTQVYQHKVYNILGDHCHTFVQHFLDSIGYQGCNFGRWDDLWLVIHIMTHASFTSWQARVEMVAHSLVLLPWAVYFWGMPFIATWLLGFAFFSTWGLLHAHVWSSGVSTTMCTSKTLDWWLCRRLQLAGVPTPMACLERCAGKPKQSTLMIA